jgi:Na+/H+ antiporter NhaC
MKYKIPVCALSIFMCFICFRPVFASDITVRAPEVFLSGIGFAVDAEGLDADSPAELRINGEVVSTSPGSTISTFDVMISKTGTARLEITQHGRTVFEKETPVIPGWVSLLPPLIAILLAFILRSVIPSLFIGLLIGAWAINGMTWPGAFSGFFETVSIYIVNTAIDPDHMAIIAFTFLTGGMIGVISRNGGMIGVVQRVMPFASTPRRGQGIVAAMGLAIFFDDYGNTMIVGNTTRPMCDKLRISREKLAYLVDSTAAPVSTIAVITTWIGFQVGLIDSAITGLEGIDKSAFVLFLNSIPYSFYAFLAIFYVIVVVLTGKDFGPMYKAEMRARTTGQVANHIVKSTQDKSDDNFYAKEGIPCRAFNAALPILTMILTVVLGLFISGEGENLTDIIGSADAFQVLIWATMVGCLVATLLSLGQKLLTLNEIVDAWIAGAQFMLTGIILLVMAWAIADVSSALQTAPYLIDALRELLNPYILPAVVFVISAATAFASGSSWGVMAILMPLVVPLCWAVLQGLGIADAEHMHILYSCIASVLIGAVWADHCSPIADTTVLSSLATGCHHMDHVRTQIPYAVLGGLAALLIGVLPAGFGLPWFLLLPTAAIILFLIHRCIGKPTD